MSVALMFGSSAPAAEALVPAAALPEAEAAAEELPAPPQPASSMAAMHTHRASAKTFFIMIFLL